jgi:glycosyltransferase involved in cell wall biosynthesis
MERYGLLDRFNVVFAGNMGKAQALDKVIGAAEILYKKNKKIQFVFVGDGVEVNELKKQSDKLISKNILFIDRQPVEEIGKILSVASVLLVHLRDEPLFRITIPSKIQAYMAAGKPLLVALKGDASELVEKVKCGLTCDPEDPYEIAQKILMLHDIKEKDREKMGYNGKRYYESNMSFKVAADKFEGIFKEVVYNNNILI